MNQGTPQPYPVPPTGQPQLPQGQVTILYTNNGTPVHLVNQEEVSKFLLRYNVYACTS